MAPRLAFESLSFFTFSLLSFSFAMAQEPAFDKAKIFDEVWNNVREQFYRVNAVKATWEDARDMFKPQAMAASSHDQFADVMSRMLATLRASHTAYFPTTNPKRFQLLGVFEFLAPADREDLLAYESIGVDTETIAEKIFVRSVFDGFPAAEAGIRFGDEIVAVDARPFHPI